MILRYTLSIYIALVAVILILPICIVVVLSFGDQSFLRFPPLQYSLRWFRAIVVDPHWMASVWLSLRIAVISSIVATAIGFFGSYALRRGHFSGKLLILMSLMLPMIVPSVVSSIAMYFFAVEINMVGNTIWIALCHAVISLPIVVLILLTAMQGVDPDLERAAFSLGAGRWRVIFKVVVPITMPSIVSAGLFAFLASFDELLISLFLSDVSSQTLPVRIWNSLQYNVEPIIAAVSTLLVALTTLVLALDGMVRKVKS